MFDAVRNDSIVGRKHVKSVRALSVPSGVPFLQKPVLLILYLCRFMSLIRLIVVAPHLIYLAPGKTCSMSCQNMTFWPFTSSQVMSSMSGFPSKRNDWVVTIIGRVADRVCVSVGDSRSEEVKCEKQKTRVQRALGKDERGS